MYKYIVVPLTCLAISINRFKFNVDDLTDREKCPACFGVSMCPDLERVQLDWTDFNSIFNNLFGVKNVYFGQYAEQRVVLKKLATNSEWAAFDAMLSDNKQQDFGALIVSELSAANHSVADVKLRLCPAFEKMNDLFAAVDRDSANRLEYLWTALKINAEPIILQILGATADDRDWPIPKYFGACGRLAVQEYVGPALTAFYAEPWLKRAKIACSLLEAANQFTFKSEQFAFYFTDASPDNVAVNHRDEAIFVDLENVIIVDKNPEDTSRWGSWNDIHTSDIEGDALVFSTSDICEHKFSDHNYYAICQHVLAGTAGFLHDPPEYIVEKYPMLQELLQQCSRTLHARIDSGTKLAHLLREIVNKFS